MKTIPPVTATVIGSVPFLDVAATVGLIAETLPVLPCWPQFSRRAAREDMILQSADGLPLLQIDEENRRVNVRDDGREEGLTEFYEHFLAQDLEWFAVPDEAAAGLPALLEKAGTDPSFGPEFLKGQFTGPITFGQSVRTSSGMTLLDDAELADTVPKGLGLKGAWLAEKIRALGRTPVVFFDEPGLTGFGSAFSNLKREQVIALIDETADHARSGGDIIIGCHVCGNTDWAMLADTTLDIINFDAYGFLENFLLYPKQIKAFLERGGYVAWGIVPTKDYDGSQTAEMLAGKLRKGWDDLTAKGVDPELIRSRALITPSCGTGSIREENAVSVHRLLPRVASLLS